MTKAFSNWLFLILALIPSLSLVHAAPMTQEEYRAFLRQFMHLLRTDSQSPIDSSQGIQILNGPLITQLFYDANLRLGRPGYTSNNGRHGELSSYGNFGYVPMGLAITPRGQWEEIKNTISPYDQLEEHRIVPLFGIGIEHLPNRRTRIILGRGFQRILKNKPITEELLDQEIRRLSRAFINQEVIEQWHAYFESSEQPDGTYLAFDEQEYRSKIMTAIRASTLESLIQLRALGLSIPNLEALLEQMTTRHSEVRERLAQSFSRYLRNTPRPHELSEFLRQHGLNRSGSKALPPLMARLDRPYPSRMTDLAGHPDGALQRNVLGRLVQINGLPNPLIPFIGRKLSEVPVDVLRQAGIGPDLRFYHRTRTADGASNIASGNVYASTGDASLLGGHASWGEGLYLGAQRGLAIYGTHLITVELNPDAVIGRDIDLFNGQQDGMIAVIKHPNAITRYFQGGNPNTFYQHARDHIQNGEVSAALEVLNHLSNLLPERLNELGDVPAYLSLRYYLHLRLHPNEPLPDALKTALKRALARPETLYAADRVAFQTFPALFGTLSEPLGRRLVERLQSMSPVTLEPGLQRVLSQYLKLVSLNAPEIIIENQQGILTNHIQRELVAHIPATSRISPIHRGIRSLNIFDEALKQFEATQAEVAADGTFRQRTRPVFESLFRSLTNQLDTIQNALSSEYQHNSSKTLSQLVELRLLNPFSSAEFLQRISRLFLWDPQFAEALRARSGILGILTAYANLSSATAIEPIVTGGASNPLPLQVDLLRLRDVVRDSANHVGSIGAQEVTPASMRRLPTHLREAAARLISHAVVHRDSVEWSDYSHPSELLRNVLNMTVPQRLERAIVRNLRQYHHVQGDCGKMLRALFDLP